jgi:hypothetical protein
VAAAYREASESPVDHLPEVTSADLDEWEVLLGCLADGILWDRDFELGHHVLDAPPDAARAMLSQMRIDPGYFTAIAPDPSARDLDAARCVLAELTGRPAPGGGDLSWGFRDRYHDLFVGPCGPEEREQWVGRSRHVEAVGVSDPGDFDCSYAEWSSLFRDALLRAADASTSIPEPGSVLSPAQVARTAAAAAAGGHVAAGGGRRVERAAAGWVVHNERGEALVDVEDQLWSAGPNDPDLPPVSFPTPGAAWAALVWSDRLARERAARREAALRRLGR